MQASASETNLPRAVRATVERVRSLQAARADLNPNPTDPAPTEPTVPNAETTPVTAPNESRGDPRHADPRYWESRYHAEVGIHKATRTRHAEQMGEMNQRIAELQEQLRAAQASAPPPKIDLGKFFTPDQIERFGEDQCEAMARASLAAADQRVKDAVAAEVEPLKQQQTHRARAAADDELNQFKSKLTELEPDWETTDKTPAWLDWLEEIDPETELQYGSLVDHHAKARNATAVAKLMRKFKQLTHRQVPTPPVTPAGSGAAPHVDTPPPGTPEQPSGLTPLRPGEATAFYTRSALGKVSDEERRIFEARLKLGSSR